MQDVTLEYVEHLADQLSISDQRALATRLTEQLQNGQPTAPNEQRQPQDLYGIWRGYFPDDIDIDAALFEIRHEWEEEWPEAFRQ